MINQNEIQLKDALLTNGLPDVIGKQTWAMCMSIAIRNQMRQMLEFAERARLYASVDTMSNEVLDIMAIDLKVPEYKQTYTLETKRSLIKAALTYWSKTGTKIVVENICTEIFGDASVVEWYEYNGEAGYFKVSTANSQVTEKHVDDFKRAIESVKRLSAWLDSVELLLTVPAHLEYSGFALCVSSKHLLKMN